jgi:hypothetical protein
MAFVAPDRADEPLREGILGRGQDFGDPHALMARASGVGSTDVGAIYSSRGIGRLARPLESERQLGYTVATGGLTRARLSDGAGPRAGESDADAAR